ncbi:MAG: GWxTD domain-containing protein [Bacteroidetes bacterium]|nr:GWxTD domain-containing protein [Bacteroidota bacterium]
MLKGSINISIIVVVSWLLMSCNSGKLSSFNYNNMYNQGISVLNPDLFVKHTQDSAILFLIINPAELLFKNGSGEFEASVYFTFSVYENYTSSKVIDSVCQRYTLKKNNLANPLTLQLRLPKPALPSYIAHASLHDLHRSKHTEKNIRVDASSMQSAINFSIWSINDSSWQYTNWVRNNAAYKITGDGLHQQCWVRYFKDDFPIAAPPFKQTDLTKFSYKSDSAYRFTFDTDVFAPDFIGLYHFQYDTLIKDGLTLIYEDNDYPRIRSAAQMKQQMRYITTNEEYNSIINSDGGSKHFDDFWLKCAGNESDVKKLQELYFQRVQQTNKFFTSYTSGWKTDRGMMYIVFGPPAEVYRNNKEETWAYTLFNQNSVRFTFARVKNPFSDNDYQLIRSISYEYPWTGMVDMWRKGEIKILKN